MFVHIFNWTDYTSFIIVFFLIIRYAFAQTTTVTSTSEAEVSLSCPITSNTVFATWNEESDTPQGIYTLVNGAVQDNRDSVNKYDNFGTSLVVGTSFSLVIKPVQDTDGGSYVCRVSSTNPTESGTTPHNLKVEVPGTISIRDENDAEIESPLDVTVGEPYPITCQVIGARSSNNLDFTWNTSSGTTTENNPTSDGVTLMDYTSTIEYQPARGPTSIICSLGQFESQLGEVTDSVTLNIRYRPDCTLTYSSPGGDCTQVELTCNCDANPEPETYEFYQDGVAIDGTISGNTATVNVGKDSPTAFTCRASNSIDGDSGFGDVVQPEDEYTCSSKSTDEPTTEPTTTGSPVGEGGCIISWVLVAVLTVVMVILAVALVLLYWKNTGATTQSKRDIPRSDNHPIVETVVDGTAYMDLTESDVREKPDQLEEIPEKNVTVVSTIPGEGFIEYRKVKISRIAGSEDAVMRSLSDSAPIVLLKLWYAEIKSVQILSKQMNVVHAIGWCNAVPRFLLTELLSGENLSQHLSQNYSPQKSHQYGNIKRKKFQVEERGDPSTLPKYALDVSRGMRFLLDNKFIHPGLRASKILVDSAGRCKVYDFLSTERSDELTSLLWAESVPYQWMSPEYLLLGTISSAGDIWSFGVLLWEIFSYGSKPYSGQDRNAVETSLRKMDRLSMPQNCPGAIWNLMILCWEQKPEQRPGHDEIFSKISTMCNDDKEYAEISPNKT